MPGYLRVFNKVSRVWPAQDPEADPRAVAVLAARRSPSAALLGTAFEVPTPEFHSLSERERDYQWEQVAVASRTGS